MISNIYLCCRSWLCTPGLTKYKLIGIGEVVMANHRRLHDLWLPVAFEVHSGAKCTKSCNVWSLGELGVRSIGV